MSNQITPAQLPNIHPLAHILGTWAVNNINKYDENSSQSFRAADKHRLKLKKIKYIQST